jgi:hypothetical protein
MTIVRPQCVTLAKFRAIRISGDCVPDVKIDGGTTFLLRDVEPIQPVHGTQSFHQDLMLRLHRCAFRTIDSQPAFIFRVGKWRPDFTWCN